MHNVNDVRQVEVHTVKPLVPGRSHLEIEIFIAELKEYQILAELFQAGGAVLLSKIHKLVYSVWNSLISGRRLLLYQFTKW
jgi:hypothetical protein